MQIGQKIRKVRELRNFTQEFMAKSLGITQGAYSRIETGQTMIDLNRMEEIARILNVDTFTIMKFDESFIFRKSNNN